MKSPCSGRHPPALMFQGTGSDVGKSLLVAGLARAFVGRGLAVRPFKPQNMSNNAAVTKDGGEIGRAQALQARAARIAPVADMNPVLLKPQSDVGAQVVVQGRVLANASARDYYALKPTLLPRVLESFQRLAQGADLMLVEGAGAAAEVNLRAADIANMGFAEAADIDVVLVADIDRGGVIAAIVGTWELLPPAERARLKGYVINKFRGDASLFTPAVELIKARTGLDCLGIVPFFPDAALLPAEDGATAPKGGGSGAVKIAVTRLSRMANFDDFDPLAAEPGVTLSFVGPGQALPGDADWIILPGSKATIADLAFLRAQGWDIDLAAHLRRGGKVLGICAGFQMLGKSVADPLGLEGPAGSVAEGLGYLEVDTVISAEKTLVEVAGFDPAGHPVHGYEMHMGRTDGPDCARPFLTLAGRPDGAVSSDGRVMGGYLHGLFSSDRFRSAFLGGGSDLAHDALVERVLDGLAAHLAGHVDLDRLLQLASRD
ncbi:cobyric acid synthase [Magnetospirillum moscoviense]|uniref:Cobyric acid synthase n=1 Tax=Magnetospirillum moscoviense TaxID=1437059 RepID=A0A178MZY5_9PROT|nr:cobyric acid synthase [Magnetospirillum moscoviense]OAN65519.1 cobyric acid synthase CobQ [Magnetospirillum moscoviense]